MLGATNKRDWTPLAESRLQGSRVEDSGWKVLLDRKIKDSTIEVNAPRN